MTRAPVKRSGRVIDDFKRASEASKDDCCAVCRWRPPRVLREIAGGMIDRLLHAHHVLPVSCGGADTADNLILVCPTHHAMAHYMGNASRGVDGQWEWQGPLNRRELLICFGILKDHPEEYKTLAIVRHNVSRHLDDLHDEALKANGPRRGFTLERGLSPRLVGRWAS